MGISTIELDYSDPVKRREFVKFLLADLEALDRMLKDRLLEDDCVRIGLEQEFNLIDYSLRPLWKNLELIKKLKDDHFTTELAKFNVEINLDPRVFKGDCFSKYEKDLVHMLTKANRHAHKMGGKVILTGILPSIREGDINIDTITPLQRYMALNEVLTKIKGKDFELNIQGLDELIMKANSVLFEACNTSFQMHLQINPYQFKEYSNWAKAISGPILACMVNSPMFLGKRLWKETRIALFQQSTDIRKGESSFREERPRVFFGYNWEKGSVVDHYKENLSRYKILLTREIEGSSLDVLDRGEIPDLKALSLHNGTIYTWNRACYGVSDGKPHIRIEARYIPAGPTIVDQIANNAFWCGVMAGMPEAYGKIDELMDFDDAKSNFMKAAQFGLSAQFKWMSDKLIPAQELLLKELIPIAEIGLKKANIKQGDIDKYLGIIKDRIESERTGAQWILESHASLRKNNSNEEAIVAITEGIYQRQKVGNPVHTWKLAEIEEGGSWKVKYWKISQVMTTDIISVSADEVIDLVRNVMLWSNIHHVPVEDDDGALIGMVSSDTLLSFYGNENRSKWEDVTVGEIMDRDMIQVDPDTLTSEAIKIMKDQEISFLPVVRNGKIVGMFTEKDYIKFGEQIFREMAAENESDKSKKA